MVQLQHETADISGTPIHYVTAGAGPTILFLHGFPEFWYAWREQLAAFAPDHQVVAADLPGYNLSGKPEGVAAYAMPQVVGVMGGLIERISPDGPVVLVGHDWGGITAWGLAAFMPHLLSHLVIINAPHPTILARELANNRAQQVAMAYAARFRQEGAEDVLRANNFGWLRAALFEGTTRPAAFTAEDQAAYLAAWDQPGALTGMLNYYRANGLGDPTTTPLPAVRVPTLVLWGEQDRVILPGNLDGLDTVVPNVQIERLPQGTHWVVHEEGPRITAAIRAFITQD